MGWFDTALSDRVRYKEEIKLAVNNFRLLNEALVDVSSLWWVVNVLSLCGTRLLEESLTNALIYNNESNFRFLKLFLFLLTFLCSLLFNKTVFFRDDLVELLQFVVNNLLPHGVTHTVTVDENVLWHFTIKFAIAVKGALEIVRKHI